MASKGEETRKRILDAAQAMILDHGFAGVSVEQLIQSLGLTKGAFFHHFRNKNDLARSLIRRYADEGMQFFTDSLARARKLSDDPLQQFLIIIGLYEEMFAGLTEPYPGCLLASYVYELQQFDAETRRDGKSTRCRWPTALCRCLKGPLCFRSHWVRQTLPSSSCGITRLISNCCSARAEAGSSASDRVQCCRLG